MADIPQGTNETGVSPTTWNLFVDKINDLVNGINTPTAFPDGDTTPSVALDRHFITANASGTTITTFDDGTDGKRISIIAGDNNTSIATSATLLCAASGTLVMVIRDAAEFILDSAVWVCVSYQQNT